MWLDDEFDSMKRPDFAPTEVTHLPRPLGEPEGVQPSFMSTVNAYRQCALRDQEAQRTGESAHSGDVLLMRLLIGCYPSDWSQRN